jgi:hypothetical protein
MCQAPPIPIYRPSEVTDSSSVLQCLSVCREWSADEKPPWRPTLEQSQKSARHRVMTQLVDRGENFCSVSRLGGPQSSNDNSTRSDASWSALGNIAQVLRIKVPSPAIKLELLSLMRPSWVFNKEMFHYLRLAARA